MGLLTKYLESGLEADLFEFRKVYQETIPSWHLTMLNDLPRNDFYRREIRAKVTGKVVLDIGCGSGLLTSYALDAGAVHVYSVERDPILQTCFEFAFRKEIAQGRVTLFKDFSSKLAPGDLKQGPPQVVVHEIFSNDLFSEHVMEAFDDLFQRGIVNSTMEFIPQKFKLWGSLHLAQADDEVTRLEDAQISERFWFLENIVTFGQVMRYLPFHDKRGNDLSKPFEILAVDMKAFQYELKSTVVTEARDDGNYLRTWFELLGDEGRLGTDVKKEASSHWENALYLTQFEKGRVRLDFQYASAAFTFRPRSQY